MKVLLALVAGYAIGARAGGDDIDEIVKSLRAIKDSDEFRDLVAGLRSHASHTLHELASMVERPVSEAGADGPELVATSDLVERVRQLAGLR